MSQHFECMLALDLKPETPPEVISALEWMAATDRSGALADPPSHDFFETDGPEWMLQVEPGEKGDYCLGGSFCSFARSYRYTLGSEDHYRHSLGFRREILDDCFYEWRWQFLDWIAPYSETHGFVGYHVELDERWSPTCVFIRDGDISEIRITEGMEPAQPAKAHTSTASGQEAPQRRPWWKRD